MRETERTRAFRWVWEGRRLFGLAAALILVGALAVVGLVQGPPSAEAARGSGPPMDVRMTIPGVRGDGPKGTINLESWSWGCDQSGSAHTGGGGGAGKCDMHSFSLKKKLDSASPKLLQGCCSAEDSVFPEIIIETCRASCESDKREAYLEIRLENAYVSSYAVGAVAGDDRPVEEISFSFEKVTVKYATQTGEGIEQGWVCPGWTIECSREP